MVKQPLNHHGKFIGKDEIFEDLETFNTMRKAYMPRKGIRYYALKLATKFVSKEILKKILMKFR